MSPLFTAANLATQPIQDGDAGFILRKDGSFQIFTTGVIDPNALTARQQEQGELLMMLAVAVKSPQIHALLRDITSEVTDEMPVLDLGAKH